MMGREGFDRWADAYDESVHASEADGSYPFAGYGDVLKAVHEAVTRSAATSVLDIGFGTGILARRFYADGLAVTGIDFSARMAELARKEMPGATLVQHDFADGLPESVTGRQYGAIVSTYALHHLPDEAKARFLWKLFGLLAPGGVLAIGDVAFETEADRDAVRKASGAGWDDTEHYLIWDGFKGRVGLPFTYRQMSPCAGWFVLEKPRMILFDYGGTLACENAFDSLASTQALLRHATSNRDGLSAEEIDAFVEARFEGLHPVRQEKHIEVHEHPFLRFVYEYLGIGFDLPPVELERVIWDGAQEVVATDGVTRLLSCLRRQGIRTGVVSNMMFSGEALTWQLKRLLPEHAFEFVMATSDYVFRKPDPLIFELALRKAGLPPEAVWYCGNDFACDVEGAAGAGILPVWYTREPDGRENDVRCVTVADWKQLTAWLGCSTIEN